MLPRFLCICFSELQIIVLSLVQSWLPYDVIYAKITVIPKLQPNINIPKIDSPLEIKSLILNIEV